MPLPLAFLRNLQSATPRRAWADLFGFAWETCSMAMDRDNVSADLANRDRALGSVDLFLATAGWDLWTEYEAAVDRTADELAAWWDGCKSGKAVLILDALSLRETPWILEGAKARGYVIHQARPTGAELPPDTTAFAKALGFGQRSALENNSAGGAHRLPGARTEALALPWEDCANAITADAAWVLWHHWPDHRLHDMRDAGKGISTLAPEIVDQLSSESFWKLVERLTTGRRLVVTSDHGYAVSGNFPDVSDKDQAAYLKKIFKANRWSSDCSQESPWSPPIDQILKTRHGEHRFVLGRRKWKAQGGYPTLTHGGLSVLEVATPFIEISRQD